MDTTRNNLLQPSARIHYLSHCLLIGLLVVAYIIAPVRFAASPLSLSAPTCMDNRTTEAKPASCCKPPELEAKQQDLACCCLPKQGFTRTIGCECNLLPVSEENNVSQKHQLNALAILVVSQTLLFPTESAFPSLTSPTLNLSGCDGFLVSIPRAPPV